VTEKMTNGGFLGRTMRLRLKPYGSDRMSTRGSNDVTVNHETDVPNGNVTERLMTVSELASQLRYSPGWVRERVRAGEIPCIRFNSRAWRFHWPTVLAALKNL
jgi:excisionase family DNA binding protein